MTDYGYANIGKLADFANNTIGGLTANDIMRFPRADVQPVKHGKFIPFTDKQFYEHFKEQPHNIPFDGECSICGAKMFNTDKYCGECGARMEEGQDD